jgi:phosphate starvation-inducible PhoH-like protein
MKKKDTSPRIPQRDKLKGALVLKPLSWTEKQKQFLELALDKNVKIIFVKGPAGSAKTILATYACLEMINQHRISDIMYVRSAVESADNKLGFLPGEIEDKMHFYGVPFLDKLEELLPKHDAIKLITEKRIEIFPVNYIRGLSWNARGIIVDEAQNLTQKELVTVLTRIGKFSKCFVLADPMQSDINGKSGAFENMCDLFRDKEAEANGIVYFELDESDIMRSDLCRFLVNRFKHLQQQKFHH